LRGGGGGVLREGSLDRHGDRRGGKHGRQNVTPRSMTLRKTPKHVVECVQSYGSRSTIKELSF
jgi:hypothetical protein